MTPINLRFCNSERIGEPSACVSNCRKAGTHRSRGVFEYQCQVVGLRPTGINAVVSGILRISIEVNVRVYKPGETGVIAEIQTNR